MPRNAGGPKGPSTRGASKHAITFGLVNVPVVLKSIEKPKAATTVSANYICPVHRTKIKQIRSCDDCGGAVDAIKAFPWDGQYIEVDEDTLDTLVAAKTGDLVIESVVPIEEIDPLFFKTSFMCWPESAHGVYDLLAAALREAGVAAVGNAVIGRSKSNQLIVLRWSDAAESIVAHGCLYDESIRWDEIDQIADAVKGRTAPPKVQVEMAKQLLDSLAAGSFDATTARDTYRDALEDMLTQAAAGQPLPTPAVPPTAAAPVQDLMEQLRQSVAAAKGAAAKPAAKKKAAAKKPAARAKVAS